MSYTNWAGVVDTSTAFSYVYGRIYETTATNCTNTDTHATWVGLGGYGKGTALLQNGTEQESTLGHDYAWYEAISNTGHDDGFTGIGTNVFPISAGDEIALYTQWFGGSNAHAVFYFHNYRSGVVLSVSLSDKSVSGDISDYHDGHSAEAVDERVTRAADADHKTKWLTRLRQHTPTQWHNVVTNRGDGSKAIRSRVHDTMTMTNTNGNTTLEKPDVSSSTLSDFTDRWKACGSEESNP